MTIPSFDLLRPTSVLEACQLLSDLGDNTRPIAGGTTLVTLMKQRALRFSHLVDLQSITGMDGITHTEGQICIGALATHRSVERSALVREHIPVVADVFGRIGSVRIRETATVGGNLAHADYRLDPPPALMILDAELVITGVHGTRIVPLKDFYVDMFETVLGPGEIITELRVSPMPTSATAIYNRFSALSANDWPCLGIAALLYRNGQRVEELRLGLSGVATTPVLVKELDQLRGSPVSEEFVATVCKLVAEQIAPVSDLRGSADYKREMAAVFTSRTLNELAKGSKHA